MARRTSLLGFTLVELAVVMAVTALLVTLALPTFTAPMTHARRSDAVAALTRLQAAQEQYRLEHGVYAAEPEHLRGRHERSESGWYDITWNRSDPWRFEAQATPRADSPQRGDSDCAPLTLRAHDGMVEHGPSLRCWNR